MNEMAVKSRPMTELSIEQKLESVSVSLARLCAHKSMRLKLLINDFANLYLESFKSLNSMDVGRTDNSKIMQVMCVNEAQQMLCVS